jgi:hypothetical protein
VRAYLDGDYGPGSAYLPLRTQCWENQIGEYKYKVRQRDLWRRAK